MRSLRILCAAALVLLEAGCGLPNPYYLAPPGIGNFPAGAGATLVTFTSPGYLVGSLTILSGIEVYYKFLLNPPSGTDINLGGGGIPGPGNLTSNGYMPLCLASDQPPSLRTKPFITLSGADAPLSIQVTLTFNGSATASTYSYTSPTTSTAISVNIGRNVSYQSPPITSKAFSSNSNSGGLDYVPSDPDAGSLITAQGYSYLVLYALSYGYEADNTSYVEYSTPVYLGYIQLSPFP